MKKEALDFNKIISLIETHRQNAYRKINEELIFLYYKVGEIVSKRLEEKRWGQQTITCLSNFIIEKFPNLKGFSVRCLYRMAKFYQTYRHNVIVPAVLAKISWTNNVLIFERCKKFEEKKFYIGLCIKNNYSSRELNRQISTNYYKRYLLSNGNVWESSNKTVDEDDIPNTRILDHFSLEFLDLPNNYSEKDIRKAIVSNLKDFILEIGRDFTFVDEEHRIEVGGQDFYIDLLFYNRSLLCLVAFELKLGDFIPEYVSKMDFYLEALDRCERKENENPSVGVILCSSKNKTIVELSKSRSNSSSLVSTYTTNLIDLKALERRVTECRELYESKVKK
jgi:predicted nuclease of restriction endonuclease-like (RecB) superfamily